MRILYSIEVDASVSAAYEQCRQLEELPRLLPAVHEVTPEEPNGMLFRVAVGDKNDPSYLGATLIEATPEQRITWSLDSGSIATGEVGFTRLGDQKTRVELDLLYRGDGDSAEIDQLVAGVEQQLLALQQSIVAVPLH